MPDFSHESRLACRVAGVDEVGRGPLAGPVLAAAVILPAPCTDELAALLDDSKRLSAAQRQRAAAALAASGAHIGIGAASVPEILRLNILHAALLAMKRAVARLPHRPDHLLIDGSHVPQVEIPCTALVGGDGISLSIAAASIIAKITRDRIMARLDARYPGFAWGRNAGYGTETHRAAITALGRTPHHRAGFGPLLE
ncbi:MAG TPA: ribonuclease HII [Acetobacteraceae bacterium]|nr:ribonuclease HII [Acetobacteraceae bacterium]